MWLVLIFFLALQTNVHAENILSEAPIILLDKEGQPRCKIADPDQTLVRLKECDEVELNPEEIRAAAVIPPTFISKKALMAAGVYGVSLLAACPAGHVTREYLGESYWANFWGGVVYFMAVATAFESLVPVSLPFRVLGGVPILALYTSCHGYFEDEE